MSRLVAVLFPEPTLRRSPLALVRWWESRRLTFNVVVGATGLVTMSVLVVGVFLPMGIPFTELPWRAVIAYGVAANVCYSFGWIAESALERWLGRETYGAGPALFRHGLVFSTGLTLFPVVMAGLFWLQKVVHWLGGHFAV
jgi:hypothetical protein